MTLPGKRTVTTRVSLNENTELRISKLVFSEGENDEVAYLELRRFDKVAEIYGHGLLIPWAIAPLVPDAISRVMDE